MVGVRAPSAITVGDGVALEEDVRAGLKRRDREDRGRRGRIRGRNALGSSSTHGKRLSIECPCGYLDDVGLGDSIALNGACMTVTTLDVVKGQFTVDISAESLDKPAGLDQLGSINLEKALRAHDRLGGHIVSGHVDGIGCVTHFKQAMNRRVEMRVLEGGCGD